MAKNQVFRKVLDENGEPLIVNGDFVSELVFEEEVEEPIVEPNWRNFKEQLFNTSVYFKALQLGNPNVYATLLKLITDGEQGYAKEDNFVTLFNMLGIDWSEHERQTVNEYLQLNNFTITV